MDPIDKELQRWKQLLIKKKDNPMQNKANSCDWEQWCIFNEWVSKIRRRKTKKIDFSLSW